LFVFVDVVDRIFFDVGFVFDVDVGLGDDVCYVWFFLCGWCSVVWVCWCGDLVRFVFSIVDSIGLCVLGG